MNPTRGNLIDHHLELSLKLPSTINYSFIRLFSMCQSRYIYECTHVVGSELGVAENGQIKRSKLLPAFIVF